MILPENPDAIERFLTDRYFCADYDMARDEAYSEEIETNYQFQLEQLDWMKIYLVSDFEMGLCDGVLEDDYDELEWEILDGEGGKFDYAFYFRYLEECDDEEISIRDPYVGLSMSGFLEQIMSGSLLKLKATSLWGTDVMAYATDERKIIHISDYRGDVS